MSNQDKPITQNNPVLEAILNQDESAQRYTRLTSGIPRSPVIDALIKQDINPKPKDYGVNVSCRVGKTEHQYEELNRMMLDDGAKSGTSYCTVTSDDKGVHIKHHKAEDVLQDVVYGTSHVEHNEPLSPKQLDTIAERSGQLLEDSLKPVHVGNWDDIVNAHERPIAASQAKDSEMSELLRKATGRQEFIDQMASLQRNSTEAHIDILMHGKPLNTMSEAEYNEAETNRAASRNIKGIQRSGGKNERDYRRKGEDH